MRSAVVVFPGSNRDHDMIRAIGIVCGRKPEPVWYGDTDLPEIDLIVLPGGFSYGDYLRAGAIAARAPIMPAIVERAAAGTLVLGVCNGFQILCEIGLLPGVLMRNANRRFVCRDVFLRVETTASPFTGGFRSKDVIRCPVAHGEGNYRCDEATLRRLEDESRIAFRYAEPDGRTVEAANVNGSVGNIAGILNQQRNVLGMMPHPENLVEAAHGGTDGRGIFESIMTAAMETAA